jgi:hypothetical protein
MHILYALFGGAYILDCIWPENFLHFFKVVPLVLLIILIMPSSHDGDIMKVILGVICGIAGDEIL